MAHPLELPENIQNLIRSEFEKASKQHQFEELAECLLKSDPDFKDHPAELFTAVNALLQDTLGVGQDVETVSFLH